MMTIMSALMASYAIGWCFGASLLYIHRFMEATL